MEDVQRSNGVLLDSWRNRSGLRHQRLAKAEWIRVKICQTRSCLLRSFRRYSFRKLSSKIHDWNSNSWGSLFLWVLNDDGKCSFRDLLSSYRHFNPRQTRKELSLQCHIEYWVCDTESWMVSLMDWCRQHVCRKTCSFCMCWRYFLFWKFLCHFLA